MTQPVLPEVKILEETETIWGDSLIPAGCLRCGQAFLVPKPLIGRVCPHCAQDSLALQPVRLRPEPPELVLPPKVGEEHIQRLFADFIQPVRLRPKDLTVQNLQDRVIQMYWPMWLVDCNLTGSWQAEVGFDYQVKSSQEHYINGRWLSREVIETRIRWEARLGNLIRRYNNIAVPAFSFHNQRSQEIGGYQFDSPILFTLSHAKGAIVQIPDQPPESAWPMARENLDRAAGEECREAAAGQHIRSFQIKAQYDQAFWTQLLLPSFATYYVDDDGNRHKVLINAQSGVIDGVRMASRQKGWLYSGIFAGISLTLLVGALLLFLLAPVFPPGGAIAIVLIFLVFILGAAALMPVLWVWQWNQREAKKRTL